MRSPNKTHLVRACLMVVKNSLLFRFLFVFFLLLIFPFPLNVIPIPGMEAFLEFLASGIDWCVAAVGEYILGLPEKVESVRTGSGDTTYDYVHLLFVTLVAVISAGVWTLLSKRPISEKLNYSFLVGLRYFLAYNMLVYGLIKVIQLQFSDPSFYRLLEPYGDSSPMGLAWTFMGYSEGYNLFIGLGEVIGGVLLFHRRTTLLGSLILIPVTANIVAINFFFDVPVKLFSTELFLMALLIAGPELKNLFQVILLKKPTTPIVQFEFFTQKKWRITGMAVKWIFVVWMFSSLLYDDLESNEQYGLDAPKPYLYGLYETTTFISNGDTVPALLDHPTRWRYLGIERQEYATVYDMNNRGRWYLSAIDSVKQEINFSNRRNSTIDYTLNYLQTDSTLTLTGIFAEDTIEVHSIRKTEEDFLLTSREFSWISEYPYNR